VGVCVCGGGGVRAGSLTTSSINIFQNTFLKGYNSTSNIKYFYKIYQQLNDVGSIITWLIEKVVK
jgi:hypothetical protein